MFAERWSCPTIILTERAENSGRRDVGNIGRDETRELGEKIDGGRPAGRCVFRSPILNELIPSRPLRT